MRDNPAGRPEGGSPRERAPLCGFPTRSNPGGERALIILPPQRFKSAPKGPQCVPPKRDIRGPKTVIPRNVETPKISPPVGNPHFGGEMGNPKKKIGGLSSTRAEGPKWAANGAPLSPFIRLGTPPQIVPIEKGSPIRASPLPPKS